jgi:hypothetical protein
MTFTTLALVGFNYLLKRDWPLPILAAAAGILLGFVLYLTRSHPEVTPDVNAIIWSFSNTTLTLFLDTAFIILFYRIARRLGPAIVFGLFVAAWWADGIMRVIGSFMYDTTLVDLSNPETMAEPAFESLFFHVTSIFIGLLFVAGYYAYRRLRRFPSLKDRLHLPPSRRISRGFYFGQITFLAAVMYLIISAFMAILWLEVEGEALLLAITVGSILVLVLFLYYLIILLLLVHRMWRALPAATARTTPGKAVGFLFIPLFNLYWIFQVFWGFARDYNRTVAARGLAVPRLPQWWFLFFSILNILFYFLFFSPFVFITLPFAMTGLALELITVSLICDAVNRLPVEAAENTAAQAQTRGNASSPSTSD